MKVNKITKKISTLSVLVLTTVGMLGPQMLSIQDSLEVKAHAEEVKKLTIQEQIDNIQKSNFSDIDKITSLLDLYDKQVTEQQKVQNKISQMKIEVQTKEEEFKQLGNKIEENNKEVANLDTQIANKEQEIKDKQKEIDDKNKELEEIAKKIAIQKEKIDSIYRNVQTQQVGSNVGMLDMMLNADSLSDAISKSVGYTRLVSSTDDIKKDYDANLTKEKEVKASLDKNKKELDTAKKELEQSKKLKEVDTEKQAKKQEVATKDKIKIEKDIKASEELVKQAEKDAKEVQKEFDKLADDLIDYQTDIKKMIDESKDPKHKEILTKLNKRIEEIKPVQVFNGGEVGKTWTFDTAGLDNARKKLVETAKTQLGVSYVWGGTTWNEALDCSGLTMGTYKRALGIDTGRVTTQQERMGKEVSLKDIKTGDLIFWGAIGNTHHVAMYVGDGVYIHAPKPGDVVQYSRYDLEGASTIRRIIE